MVEFNNACAGPVTIRDLKRVMCLVFAVLLLYGASIPHFAQQGTSSSGTSDLTPRQRAIERQRIRMQSSDVEVRRDAVMRLGWIRHPDASRVATVALNDSVPIIRATTASAVLSLPSAEAVAVLIPLLKDKNEFVRQQVAFALGETRDSTAVDGLVTALVGDKQASVRGAAAVALGMIASETASEPLARVVDPGFHVAGNVKQNPKQKKEADHFVQRAAARALGQMRSRAAVPALIVALANKKTDGDVRREIAVSLGLIGDVAAVPVLRESLAENDPYLAQSAFEALQKLTSSDTTVRP